MIITYTMYAWRLATKDDSITQTKGT
jgi:hypothetical protein